MIIDEDKNVDTKDLKVGPQPDIARHGTGQVQVCIPGEWSDKEVVDFANKNCEAPLDGDGWVIRREGDRRFDPGVKERVSCTDRKGFVHLVLDADKW